MLLVRKPCDEDSLLDFAPVSHSLHSKGDYWSADFYLSKMEAGSIDFQSGFLFHKLGLSRDVDSLFLMERQKWITRAHAPLLVR